MDTRFESATTALVPSNGIVVYENSEERLKIAGRDYPIIGHVLFHEHAIPIVDIPMMTDEEWMRLAQSQRNGTPIQKPFAE